MSFRKENKYRLSSSDMARIKEQLKKIGMRELYPCRVIHSCYFDNNNLAFHHESEESVVPRKKIRIRWYNKESIYTKEIKISSIEGRYKHVEKIPEIKNLNDVLSTKYLDNTYGILKPSLIVSYERSYFSLKLLRITFDQNITYKYIKYNTETMATDNEVVMEVKAPIDCSDDYIQDIISYPVARFSKYSRGLLSFDGYIN